MHQRGGVEVELICLQRATSAHVHGRAPLDVDGDLNKIKSCGLTAVDKLWFCFRYVGRDMPELNRLRNLRLISHWVRGSNGTEGGTVGQHLFGNTWEVNQRGLGLLCSDSIRY